MEQRLADSLVQVCQSCWMPVLECTDLVASYGKTVAVNRVSLSVDAGEILAVRGSSGSGKSTLLHCLAGILTPASGCVSFSGASLSDLSDRDRSTLRRRRMGFIFQFGELIPDLTLMENVALPLQLLGTARREAMAQSQHELAALDLHSVCQHYPSEVSGGQAQRAAVARSMIHRPEVVFADEPTGALDQRNSAVVLGALKSLAEERGSTIVMVTHDSGVAALADRVVEMVDGRL